MFLRTFNYFRFSAYCYDVSKKASVRTYSIVPERAEGEFAPRLRINDLKRVFLESDDQELLSMLKLGSTLHMIVT